MEILVSLSTILKDIVKDVEDRNTKQDFVIEHIKNVTKNYFSELQLPQGKDWFNVSKPLTENDLRGKVVVLDFFTYCCINCLHLIPHLRALEETFSVADGLVVIGVHSAKFENEKNSSNIALALKRYNILHPVINDSNGYMWDKLRIACWPTVVIIGPEGQALFVLIGEQCRSELFLYVESTLKYYGNEISTHLLPISSCSNIINSSSVSFPGKIARFENILAVSDSGNHRVIVFDERGHIQFKIGGKSSGFQDGSFGEAKFNSPQGIVFYNKFKIYVADTENHSIRLIDLSKSKVVTVAGTGIQGTDYIGGKPGPLQEISSPWDLCFVPAVHVKEYSSNSFNNQAVENVQVSGNFSDLPPPPPFPSSCTSCLTQSSLIPQPPPYPSSSNGKTPQEIDKCLVSHNVLLIAMSGIHQIWALFLEDTVWWKGKRYEKNVCVAIAGSGKEENRNNSYPMMASFAQPSGLAYNARLKSVFIADSESSSIRKLSLRDGSVSHVVGGDKNPVDLFNYGDVDGKGYNAKLQHPLGLACSINGKILYVCDTYNNKLKKVDVNTSECTSLHEEKNVFNEPGGCVVNETEEILYVADTNNNSVVLFNLKSKSYENLNIQEVETEEHLSKIANGNKWEVETEVCNKGGLITLTVHLEPETVHGSWKLDVGKANVQSDESKGEISSLPQEFKLKILPSSSQNEDTVNIFFNLSFCEKDLCLFKKFVLLLVIKRNEKGKQTVKLEFRKKICS